MAENVTKFYCKFLAKSNSEKLEKSVNVICHSYACRVACIFDSQCIRMFHFYHAKQLCKRGLGDRNSVRPSVRHTAKILIPLERVINLLF